jgi:hypothetical protein
MAVLADEPAYAQQDRHLSATQRRIGKSALVAAVYPRRPVATCRTRDLPGDGEHPDPYLGRGQLDTFNGDLGQVRQQTSEAMIITPAGMYTVDDQTSKGPTSINKSGPDPFFKIR